MMDENKTLHLAITMAGAVSAGAYTAGVMDYLFEVLDKWEEMKKNPETRDKVPNHNIKIEVLSGASAGGMTAAISSIVLQHREKHAAQAFSAADADPNRLKQNPFYDAWVNLTKDDMTDELLKDKDAVQMPDGTTSCISAFNSKFISAVAERTLPEKSDGLSLKNSEYAAENLRLFVTLTNLTGFSREAHLAADTPGASRFIMQDHRDLALFRFTRLAAGEEKDGSIEVDLKNGENVDILRCAAIATGAFPFGLAYKTLRRDKTHLDDNVLLKALYGKQTRFDVPEKYRATFIDGGLINNEPFELTENLLRRQIEGQANAYTSEEFNSTILMIDPFPSDVLLPVESEKSEFPYNFSQSIAKFISSVRSQVLVKTSLLDAAFDDNNFRCFVMSPRRREYVGEQTNFFNGAKAIASGTLAGFGGFLEKEFREHDFFLGRINCKSFLQKHFKFPADTENPIFKDAYAPEIKNLFLITDDGKEFLPIIPDVNKINEPDDAVERIYKNLRFPSITPKQLENRFDNLNPKIIGRLKFFVKTNFVDLKTRFFLKVALFFLKKKLLGEINRIIRKDLEAWKILRDK